MNIVVFSTVGGVSSDFHVVRRPSRGERSKWCEEMSNLQSKDADASAKGRKRDTSVMSSIFFFFHKGLWEFCKGFGNEMTMK